MNYIIMEKKVLSNNYLLILFLHFLLGGIVFLFKPIGLVYSAFIFFLGCYSIIKKQNLGNEALFWAAYVVGAEVFLRMTKGNIGNEYGKYSIIVFLLLGIYFKGVSKKATPYFIFLLFLIPGLIVGILDLNFDTEIRKAIAFNLSGSVCLAVSCIYVADVVFKLDDFDKLTRWIIYPLIAMLVYIFLYNPSIKEVIIGTDSNSATSGGFGPNQVSTVLGLGMFLAFTRALLFSKNFLMIFINLILLILFTYRGLITFSRGGFIGGITMIILLMLLVYPVVSLKGKMKLNGMFLGCVVLAIAIFSYSITQTRGMILNRYQGKDALGREKSSAFSGREDLAAIELQLFFENPFLGIGVGKGKEYREEITGTASASHSEVTRTLSEHGMFGILNLLILLFTPLLYFLRNRQHIFLLSFFIFWLITINHAAMRIAAPAFVYALTLLKVTIIEKPTLHRE